jgi:tetratricopeptide (TPR) repeat protein
MPHSPPPGRLLREPKIARLSAGHWCWRIASWLLIVGCCCASGCRTLRCRKESDETIALTRQLALQGKDAQRKGSWDKAESCFAQAVQRSPGDERARLGYAESLWNRGAKELAITHMTEAVKLSGHDPALMVQLGQMHLAVNNLPAAARMADKALATNKQLATAWALRGNVHRASGERDEALADYHRALSAQPHYPEAQLALAEIYIQDNRPERALATLQSLADQFAPGSVPADLHFREALVLRKLARHHEAAESLTAAIQLQPHPDVLYELAQTQLELGDPGNAQLAVQRALQMNPQHQASLRLQGELFHRQQQLTASIAPPAIAR